MLLRPRSGSTSVDECPICEKKCTDILPPKCFQCLNTYHPKCINVSQDQVNYFNNNMSTIGYLWRCSSCTEKIKQNKEPNILQQLLELKNTFNQRLQELENIILSKATTQQNEIKSGIQEIENIIVDKANSQEKIYNHMLKQSNKRLQIKKILRLQQF